MPTQKRKKKKKAKAAAAFEPPAHKEHAYDYMSVFKFLPERQNWPSWHDHDFGVYEYEYKWANNEEKTQAHGPEQKKALALPREVHVLFVFASKMDCGAQVASYTGFGSVAKLQTFNDTVCKCSPLFFEWTPLRYRGSSPTINPSEYPINTKPHVAYADWDLEALSPEGLRRPCGPRLESSAENIS